MKCVICMCLCLIQWLPESPRFDVLSGNRENAMKTLRLIAADNGKTMPLGKLIANKQVKPYNWCVHSCGICLSETILADNFL